MKFPLRVRAGCDVCIVDADDNCIAHDLEEASVAVELVRRANLFGELVAACEAARDALCWKIATAGLGAASSADIETLRQANVVIAKAKGGN